MPPSETYENLIEVYRTTNNMDADRAIVEVLQPDGISCFLRDRISHALPAPDSENGGYFIAVPDAQADAARGLLRLALNDVIIGGDVIEGALP